MSENEVTWLNELCYFRCFPTKARQTPRHIPARRSVFLQKGRWPQLLGKRKTTLTFWANGRRPQLFSQMEDNLNYLGKWKMTSTFHSIVSKHSHKLGSYGIYHFRSFEPPLVCLNIWIKTLPPSSLNTTILSDFLPWYVEYPQKPKIFFVIIFKITSLFYCLISIDRKM